MTAEMQTATAQDDYDAKVLLLQAAFRYLSRDLWEEGDGERFPWVWREMDQLERDFDTLTYEGVRQRLKFLYKRIAAVKGQRGHRTAQKAPPVGAANTGENSDANAPANANTQGVNQMPIYVDVPKEVLVSRGEHPAKIVAISKPETSRFDDSKQSIKLTFEITGGKFKGEKLTKHCTLSLGSKAALGALWRRLMGETKPGVKVDLEGLLEKDVSIMVSHKTGEDGDYAVIQEVFAAEETVTT